MALSLTDRGFGQIGNTNAASHAFSSSSFTPAANALLVVVSGGFANGAGATFDTTITDGFAGGGAWASVDAASTVFGSYGFRNKISYRQVGASPGSGTITVTRSPSGTLDCFMAAQFIEFSGHDTTTPINQSNHTTGTASSLSSNLTSPAAANTVIAGLVDIFPGSVGIPSGYTAISAPTAPGGEAGVATVYDAASPSGTITWTSLNTNGNAAVSVEVKAAGGVTVTLVAQSITASPVTLTVSNTSPGQTVTLVAQTLTISPVALTPTLPLPGTPQSITMVPNAIAMVLPQLTITTTTTPTIIEIGDLLDDLGDPLITDVGFIINTAELVVDTGVEPEPTPDNFGQPTVYNTPIPPQFMQDLVFGPIVTRRRRVDIYMPDGETLFMADAPLIGGTVNVDMARDEHRIFDIVLDNDDRMLDHYPDGFWYDNIIKIYHGVETPDAVWETQIGEFMIDSIDEPHFPHQVAVKGRDYAKKLMQDQFAAATAFSKGQEVGNVIKIIALNGGIVKMNIFDDDETLVADFTFERKTSRWEAITKLADAHSLEVFFDRFGFLVLRRYRDPQSSPLAFSFLTGPQGNLASYDKHTNDAYLKNHVVVTGAATANNIPVFAEAENNNPASAASIGRIGRRTLPEESAFIGTVAQAKQRAEQLLATAGLESYSIDLGAIVAPWLDEGNAIEFLDPRPSVGQPTRYLLTSFDIPLALGTMNAHGKRLTIVTSTGAERRPPGYGVTVPPTTTPPTPGESAAPIVSQQPTNTAAAAGTQFTLSASASGSPAPTVQWQVSTTGSGGPFNNIVGATQPTYTAVATNAVNGNYYRAVFTNALGIVNSNPVQLTITATAPVGNPGKARLAWYYFDSANPPSDAVITAWAPQLALAVLHPKMTATRNKIKAANPNCRVLAAKSIWSVRTDETTAPYSTAVSYAQAQTNSWLAQTGTPTGGASSNTLPASLSGTHGSATKKVLPLVKGLPSYWGSDFLNDELQRYRDAQTTITGSTAADMVGARSIPADSIPSGYKSGAVNTFDGNPSTFTDPNNNGIIVGDYVQARVKMPSGKGFWPAIWLYDWEGGNGGNMEIDIMEMLGHQPTVIYETNHLDGAQTGQLVKSATPAGVYHTFGVWLRPTGSLCEFFIDGVSQGTLAYDPTKPTTGKWLAIVNLAIGGSWAGAPDASTVFPSTLELTELARWRP